MSEELVTTLRSEAKARHAIALMLDPHTLNDRGEPCPMDTPPLEERIEWRAARDP